MFFKKKPKILETRTKKFAYESKNYDAGVTTIEYTLADESKWETKVHGHVYQDLSFGRDAESETSWRPALSMHEPIAGNTWISSSAIKAELALKEYCDEAVTLTDDDIRPTKSIRAVIKSARIVETKAWEYEFHVASVVDET